jgi:hypothetical protein
VNEDPARLAAEAVARASYGKLVAYLAARRKPIDAELYGKSGRGAGRE